MSRQYRTGRFLLLVLPLLLIPWMISNQSLWIDEGETAFFATRPDFCSWWSELLTFPLSGVQMPAYMFGVWGLGRLGLTSEWGLRAQNALWITLAVLALWRLGPKLDAPWLGMVLVVCPFVWAYADEARPYALHIACGAWLLSGMVDFVNNEAKGTAWAIQIGLASVLLCASHLVGFFPVISAGICLLILALCRRWRLTRVALTLLMSCGLVIGLFAIYYLGTLHRGIERPRIWRAGLHNVLFSIYEFAGFSALGPPRHELREWLASGDWQAILAAVERSALAWLLLGACYLVILRPAATRSFLRRVPLSLRVCFAWLSLSLIMLSGVCVMFGFPFWGRYLAALFPCAVMVVGHVVAAGIEQVRWQRPALVIITTVLFLGSMNLRWNPRHRKDDYRSAAIVALNGLRSGRTVWWAAAALAGGYYGVPLGWPMSEQDPNCALLYSPLSVAEVRPAMPDLVILSKPSIFDSHGTVRAFVRQKNFCLAYRFNAFEIYARK
ncbi:MAG: hypothetical protein N2255_01145 [Kiritimatiellae bacterium]|nr:hypothetical protein [Kiritimatiellia bacterium]